MRLLKTFQILHRHAAKKRLIVVILVCLMAGWTLCSLLDNNEYHGKTINGVILHEGKGISNAVVRIQTTQYSTITKEDGSFSLAVPKKIAYPIRLTAWAKNYFIGGPATVRQGQNDVSISLVRHSSKDNSSYLWIPSLLSEGYEEGKVCAECHSRQGTEHKDMLPVDEWKLDAHSQSARNPRFLTLYSGTDLSGRKSPLTKYIHIKDYGTFPVPPNKKAGYYGSGYKLDQPDHAGNCASCHLPAAAVNSPYDTDPTRVTGVGKEGVNCDFCHKIWDVRLDPVTGLPFENRPGVMSFEFRRPFENHQFFAGPLDDIAPGEDTYSELQQKSQICAPCHFGIFWDTIVYNSFGEWLDSPYSDPESGKTCQDCHMPHSGGSFFALPEKGGLKRDPQTIFSHRMPGARDRDLLSNAVTMSLEARQKTKEIEVIVTIENDLTGHHVPTDSPLRHVILIVRASVENGKNLELIHGPTLPEWCGTGDPRKGYYAGLPGKVFIKRLQEEWTKISPTGAYWNPTRIVEDTRIRAMDSDISTYLFSAEREEGEIRIEAVLLYRRAHKELMEIKGWTDPDIEMEKECLIFSIDNSAKK